MRISLAKINLETWAVIGVVGYLGIAYFLKLFPFEGSLDSVLSVLKGETPIEGLGGEEVVEGEEGAEGEEGVEGAEGEDPATGSTGAGVTPTAGSGGKILSQLQLLNQIKQQNGGKMPLMVGDAPGGGTIEQMLEQMMGGAGGPPVPTGGITGDAAAGGDAAMNECAEGCSAECDKLDKSSRNQCHELCATLCVEGAVPEEDDEDGPPVPPPGLSQNFFEKLFGKVPLPPPPKSKDKDRGRKRNECRRKYGGNCNKECRGKKRKTGKCRKCREACGSRSRLALAYQGFMPMGMRPVPTHDFITPVNPTIPASSQMLMRGRPRTGFRSYAASSYQQAYPSINLGKFSMSS